MRSSFKQKIALIIMSGLTCWNFGAIISANSANNLNSSITENQEANKEDKYLEIYENFSKKFGMDKDKLIELLSLREGENNFKLIPISDSEEFTEFWKDLFVRADKNYMKYYATGKLKTDSQATADFNRRYNRMWNSNSKKNIKPFSMAFISAFNGDFAGEIVIGPVRGGENVVPEIGYVTSKKFCGKKITSNSLKILINFIKHLNKSGIYNIKTLRATAHSKNKASQKILSKCGFNAQKKLTYSFGRRPTKEYRLSIK